MSASEKFRFLHEAAASELPALVALYEDFHAHPELSGRESRTAARLAAELEAVGCAVTRNVGGHGVVAVLENGDGPTVMLRADMDALPVTEATGLPYASHVRDVDEAGREVGVMHACGHDVHVTALIGAARVLSNSRDHWRGRVLLVGQPAEEALNGARRMIEDGLFERFPEPDQALSLHVAPALPAGTVGLCEGPCMAGCDFLDLIVRGSGGHGGRPDEARDPVYAAALTVLALQGVVSRETNPVETAVLTVGSIHGGTRHNIIPDEVRLELTIRYFSRAVREQMLAAIRRVAEGTALAAGVPAHRAPILTVSEENHVPPLVNDPGLTRRLDGAFRALLGPDKVLEAKPVTGSEDFALFALERPRMQSLYFRVGCSEPAELDQARREGRPVASIHSPRFAPVPAPTIRTAVTAMAGGALHLLS